MLSLSLSLSVYVRKRLRDDGKINRVSLSFSLSLSLSLSLSGPPGYEIMPLFSEITGSIFFIGLLTSSVNYRFMRLMAGEKGKRKMIEKKRKKKSRYYKYFMIL